MGLAVFVDALGLNSVEILGFSIGSFVAQEIILTRPSLVTSPHRFPPPPRGAGDDGYGADDAVNDDG